MKITQNNKLFNKIQLYKTIYLSVIAVKTKMFVQIEFKLFRLT